MRITVDIHTRALGLIAFIGLAVIGVYHYHTAIKSTLPNAEVLELKEICIFIFFMLLPFFAAMFGNRKDLEVDKSEIVKMGKFRQILNSPKGVELIYFGMMYLLTTMLIFALLREAVNGAYT